MLGVFSEGIVSFEVLCLISPKKLSPSVRIINLAVAAEAVKCGEGRNLENGILILSERKHGEED